MDDSLFVDAPHPDTQPDLFVDAPKPSELESAGRGFANNIPLAPQAIAAVEPGSYSPNLAEWNQKAGIAKATNPVPYGVGATAGALALLAIPGVGEAMEAAPALTGMGLGAANAVSNTDILQQPGTAAKNALVGGGIGALTGGLAGKLASKAPALEDVASTQAVKTLGLRPGMLAHLEPDELQDLGTFAKDADLVNGDTASRLAKAQDLKQQVGAQIGDMGAGATPTGDLTEFVTPLQQKMEESAKYFGPEGNAELNEYRRGIANLQQNAGTFDDLQKLKEVYGERAFDANHQVTNKAAADIYGQIRDAQKALIASSPEEYQDAMTNYKNLSDITSGLTKQLGQERAGTAGPGGFGMMGAIRRLPAGIRYPAGVAGAATGHPILAAGAVMPELTNSALHTNVLSGLSKALPTATNMSQAELNDYLTSKYGQANNESQ